MKSISLIILSSVFTCSLFGQQHYVESDTQEKEWVAEKLVSFKASEDAKHYFDSAKKARLSDAQIQELLLAKTTYDYHSQKIKDLEEERKSLFLYSKDKDAQKRHNLQAYRKKIHQILSKDAFYRLYKSIVDQKAEASLTEQLQKLKADYVLTNDATQQLRTFLQAHAIEACLLREYYGYDPKLAQQKYTEYYGLLDHELQQKIADLDLQPITDILQKAQHIADPKLNNFIKKAKAIGISKGKTTAIAYRMLQTQEQLQKAATISGTKEGLYLYTLDDERYQSSKIKSDLERYLSEQLSIEEYKKLFWDQLESRVIFMSAKRYQDLSERYQLNALKSSERTLLKKWVKTFAEEEVLVRHYYGYAKSLVDSKVKSILFKADLKYGEVIYETTKKPLRLQRPEPREVTFLQNAKKSGLSSGKAQKLLKACLAYEIKQEELMATKKYDKKYLYRLSTSQNGKTKVSEGFKRFLTEQLSIQEYQKLFWNQLEPEVYAKATPRLKKVQSIYKLEGTPYTDIAKLIRDQTLKEVVAEQYYSYDKKIAKQKVKALKHKFENEYKSKIASYTR